MSKTWMLVLGLLAAGAALAEAAPCTDQMAYDHPGSWAQRSEDDLAVADPTYPRFEYPRALRNADQAMALLKKAIPNPSGIQAKAYRTIRGDSYTKNGALKYGVNALFKGYFCVPDTPSYIPSVRGQVRLGGETGTWIYIKFNDFAWLESERMRVGIEMRAKGGGTLYYFPKQGGEWKGAPLLLPTVHLEKTEAVIITPEGRLPYRFVTQEEFLEARLVMERAQVEDMRRRAPTDSPILKQFTTRVDELDAALAALTPEERRALAVVRKAFAQPGKEKLFVTEAEGGRRMFVVNTSFFDARLPRHAVQFATVYVRWESDSPPKAEAIRQFKENFDLQALRAMFGR